MQGTDRPSLPSEPRQREALTLAALAVAALAIAWILTAGGAALAGPLLQDSPIAPQEQLSPLAPAAPPVEPAQPAPTMAPAPESPAVPPPAQPPIPLEVLIGAMLAIGLVALVVGMRRR